MMPRRRFTRKKVILAAALTGSAALAFTVWGWSRTPAPASRYETLDWAERFDGDLALRSNAAGALLMALLRGEEAYTLFQIGTAEPSDTVYHFRPESQYLLRATKEEWAAAHGKIRDQRSQMSENPIAPFAFEFQKYTLRWNSEKIEAEGSKVVQVRAADNGVFVAVVSTNAWAIPSLIDFGSAVNSKVFYHQVFNRQTGLPVGPTLALLHHVPMCRPEICWSEDSKYVVYISFGSYYLWIVPVDGTATAGEN